MIQHSPARKDPFFDRALKLRDPIFKNLLIERIDRRLDNLTNA